MDRSSTRVGVRGLRAKSLRYWSWVVTAVTWCDGRVVGRWFPTETRTETDPHPVLLAGVRQGWVSTNGTRASTPGRPVNVFPSTSELLSTNPLREEDREGGNEKRRRKRREGRRDGQKESREGRERGEGGGGKRRKVERDVKKKTTVDKDFLEPTDRHPSTSFRVYSRGLEVEHQPSLLNWISETGRWRDPRLEVSGHQEVPTPLGTRGGNGKERSDCLVPRPSPVQSTQSLWTPFYPSCTGRRPHCGDE